MNYFKTSVYYKVKKVFRYIKLYGFQRTLIKIRSQFHLKRNFSSLPKNNQHCAHKKVVGIIGAGNFSYSHIAYYLRKNFGNVIKGSMDKDINRAASLFYDYKLNYYTTDDEKIINDDSIKLVYVASNHSTHAEYAIRAIDKGKAVHIEKPHITNIKQLVNLCTTIEKNNGLVRLGFNRPNSKLFNLISNYLNKEEGPMFLNWFVSGHYLEENHWYYKKNEGGRIMGNLTHWIDLSLRMVPAENLYPIKIIPTRSTEKDQNISISYVFGNQSIATISFSAKGAMFEGVRESLNAHRGDVLIRLTDFQAIRIDKNEKSITKKLFYKDQGHEKTIVDSFKMISNHSLSQSVEYIWNSGYLALKTIEALEKSDSIIVEKFEKSFKSEKNN